MNDTYKGLREKVIMETRSSLQEKLHSSQPTAREAEELIERIQKCNRILFDLKMQRLYPPTTKNEKGEA